MALSCRDSNGDKWEFERRLKGWRWKRTASNGRIVGLAPQAYASIGACIKNAQRNGMKGQPA